MLPKAIGGLQVDGDLWLSGNQLTTVPGSFYQVKVRLSCRNLRCMYCEPSTHVELVVTIDAVGQWPPVPVQKHNRSAS